MFVIAAPGQGSQKPGFLTPWLESPSYRADLERWSEIIGSDLIAHGTTSHQETITDTAIAQPLIVASGIIVGRALLEALPENTNVAFAGHSVGEFTAAALAGVLSDDDALSLVALRGRAMAEASAATPTGMSAVIGGDPEVLAKAVDAAGLFAANFNGGGQVVIAGELTRLAHFQENPPEGMRVIPLTVAGAFHTHYMQSAVAALAEAAAGVTTHEAHRPLYTNRDGSRVAPDNALGYLVDQVARPVRWDLCMESFSKDGIQGMMELAPAGALVGLAKRALKGVPTVALNSPDDLATALELVSGA
ncbi:MAG: ACP S-malonyltransferase [Actinobacteria bacterium]|nr:ACP S-malonyltransferase [Actinomycetota bacterium]MDA3002993.1 ACP S-malonyltransferase [Actinomycetota bacterium]